MIGQQRYVYQKENIMPKIKELNYKILFVVYNNDWRMIKIYWFLFDGFSVSRSEKPSKRTQVDFFESIIKHLIA
jgi:hypothetical protein